MPLDAEHHWDHEQVLGGEEVRQIIHEAKSARSMHCQSPIPASRPPILRYTDGGGRVGFINPVTQPFCGDCNRLRLTAEGQVRNCLFSTVEWDARALLRGGGSDDEIAALVVEPASAPKKSATASTRRSSCGPSGRCTKLADDKREANLSR